MSLRDPMPPPYCTGSCVIASTRARVPRSGPARVPSRSVQVRINPASGSTFHRGSGRVVGVDGPLVEVAADKPDAVAAHDVDRGDHQHPTILAHLWGLRDEVAGAGPICSS